MSDIAAFTAARLAEWEQATRQRLQQIQWLIDNRAEPVARVMEDARDVPELGFTLREVAALRDILAAHSPGVPPGRCRSCAPWIAYPCPTVRLLAGIWPDGAGYDEGWKP